MKAKRTFRCLGLAAIATLAAGARPTSAQPLIVEYPIPVGARHVTAGPDGNVWFSSPAAIGRIETDWPNTVTVFPVDISGGFIEDIVAGSDGNIWFADVGLRRVGRILVSPPHTIDLFPITPWGGGTGEYWVGLTAGLDGNLWFSRTYLGASAVRFEIAPPHTVTSFQIANSPAQVGGHMFTAADGNLWWAAAVGATHYRLEIAPPHTITAFPYGGDGFGPTFAGPDGKIWWARGEGHVGWIDPLPPHATMEFPFLLDTSAKSAGTAGPDGNVWFVGGDPEDDLGKLWKIVPGSPPTFTKHAPPTDCANILDAAAGPDGNLWFTPFGGPERLGRLVLTPLCTGVTCSALDQCHDVGTCDPTTGGCSQPAKADGTTCTGSNACTEPDACQIGFCTDTLCVSETVGAGGTVSTDGGGGATPARPVVTSVTVPGGGTVGITQVVPAGAPPSGVVFAGQLITISAPPQTASAPLVFTFDLDASRIPDGVEPAAVEIYKDGVAVASCTGAPGIAEPDPCVAERLPIVDGDLRVTVLTSTASDWFAAVPRCQAVPQTQVIATKINTDVDPSNDGIKIISTFTLPSAAGFDDFDPLADGALVQVFNAVGAPLLDAVIPGGAFAGGGTRGWSLNGKGTVWKYKDKTASPVEGIIKIVVADRDHRVPNEVKVTVVGKKGTYPIVAGDAPLRAAVVLGGTEALAARVCGEGSFAAGECAFNPPGNALKCKR